MESVFFQSMLVQPPEILGRQLRHFSAWHSLLLTLLDNPFFVGGTPDQGHIIELVWICGTQYESDGQSIFDSGVAKECRKWGKRIGEFDFDSTYDDVGIYLTDYMAFPKLWSKDIRIRESHIPVPFRVVATVLAGYPSFTESQVWNMPFSRAACFRACIAEDNGMDVVSRTAMKIIENIKKQGLEWKDEPRKAVSNGDRKSKHKT